MVNPIAEKLRWKGYRQALSHYGLTYNNRLVACGEVRFEHGCAAMEQWAQADAHSHCTTQYVPHTVIARKSTPWLTCDTS